MIQKTIEKTLIIAGTTIVAIPFVSAALVCGGILSVIWLKDKTILIFNSPINRNQYCDRTLNLVNHEQV
ncbi:MAG: hypothetical protein AAGF26_15455 [Cyanobacteria bacterium P01_G01_bin.49]